MKSTGDSGLSKIALLRPFFRYARALNPEKFCEKYAKKQKGEWGYRASWKRLLAYVLDVSEKTVEAWGPDYENCPEKYQKRLAEIDALKTAEQILKRHGLSQEFLDALD
ncbi:MAG TPA: hypothetical protein DCE56_00805 [Cyanobacteria bacterium UBA8553]|nr:hypothetical protein [Cyanobacteria bacterium UBA8553]HAJ60185.1 hypothetical protein [Cyanobacteria bacterium UBA8543]